MKLQYESVFTDTQTSLRDSLHCASLLFSNYSPWKRSPPLCHLDRSVAKWRDLRFLFLQDPSSHTPSLAPKGRFGFSPPCAKTRPANLFGRVRP